MVSIHLKNRSGTRLTLEVEGKTVELDVRDLPQNVRDELAAYGAAVSLQRVQASAKSADEALKRIEARIAAWRSGTYLPPHSRGPKGARVTLTPALLAKAAELAGKRKLASKIRQGGEAEVARILALSRDREAPADKRRLAASLVEVAKALAGGASEDDEL